MAVDEIVPSPWIDDRHNGQCSYAINDVSPSLHLEVHLDAALYCTFSLCSLHMLGGGVHVLRTWTHTYLYILNIFSRTSNKKETLIILDSNLCMHARMYVPHHCLHEYFAKHLRLWVISKRQFSFGPGPLFLPVGSL